VRLRVGFIGIFGLYNYGCEAIVRGTYKLIQKTWQDAEMILYTYSENSDREILQNLEITVKKVPERKYTFLRKVINKLFRKMKVNFQLETWDSKKILSECDIIFSIGGDIYTIPTHLIDNKKTKKHKVIVEFGNRFSRYKPYVIWGASIGPFGENRSVKKYYFNHLRKVHKIFVREEETLNYLNENNIHSNVMLCPDPAFFVENSFGIDNYGENYNKDKIRIGINLSPLSLAEMVGDDILRFQDEIVDSVISICKIPNVEVVFIPHVINEKIDKDNDLKYLKEIYNLLPKQCQELIYIECDAQGFLGTKAVLKTCDLVIAARMHCAVNAISEGVPTIFLTYSQKGLGMAKYVYGNNEWVVPLLDIKKLLPLKVLNMIDSKNLISNCISERIEKIKLEEQRIIISFKNLI
jgi:polysaccharide pyruvyl transferase WcaK-like protein